MSDTSEQYIRMADCPEIQRKANLSPGNLWHHSDWGVGLAVWHWNCRHCDQAGVERAFYFDGYGIKLLDKCGLMVWLPRQDNLQGMLPKGNRRCYLLYWNSETKFFTLFIGEYSAATYWDYDTIKAMFKADTAEQALIQGVMHELHKKKWDDKKEKWV